MYIDDNYSTIFKNQKPKWSSNRKIKSEITQFDGIFSDIKITVEDPWWHSG